MTYTLDADAKSITSVTVSISGNTCSAPIPVTLPGPVTNQNGATAEQIGSDPLVLWTKMTGSPITYTLKTPLTL